MIRNFGTRIGSEGRASRAFPGSGVWVSRRAGLGEVCGVPRGRCGPSSDLAGRVPFRGTGKVAKYEGADSGTPVPTSPLLALAVVGGGAVSSLRAWCCGGMVVAAGGSPWSSGLRIRPWWRLLLGAVALGLSRHRRSLPSSLLLRGGTAVGRGAPPGVRHYSGWHPSDQLRTGTD